ncbi:MAG: DUF3667 domain-containing protein [Novosphingobium sp.]
MSDPGQLIGDIATGALAARAAEPAHGEVADGHTHEKSCLNCGTLLIGSHCHSCGQAAHVHKTISAFFHDLLHGVFHFEGKIWRTLPMLAWHPGKLTREYIDGRRASYVSPIALFLFVVFLTFALFNLVSTPMHFDKNDNVVFSSDKNATALGEAEKRLAQLKTELAAAKKDGDQTGGLEGQIAGAEAAIAALKAPKADKDTSEPIKGDGPGGNAVASTLNDTWKVAKANPELAIYKLQSSAYKYSWLLIPLSVPFVWLLFPFNRRFHLYDHTVFVTYSLCFMLLVLAAITAINVYTSLGAVIAVLMLYVPFHMHRQLRETYGLTRLGALWRTWMLGWFSVFALTLWAIAVLALAMG